MKLTALILTFVFSALSFAETIPGNSRNIKINHIVVGTVAKEVRQVPCRMADTDLNCYETVSTKEVVEVTVGYISSIAREDENFTVQFLASEFTAEELKALSIRSSVKRVQAANKIFDLVMKKERRTGSYTYCPYEMPATCRPGEEWTREYDNEVLVVNVVKKAKQ